MTDLPACDVTVIGGGPAGSLCALHLLSLGLEVRLVDENRPRQRRPPEILAPSTLRALRAAGLQASDLAGVGRVCHGVASRWDGAGYFDYELMACERALAVDRCKLDRVLQEAAGRRGAIVCAPCHVRRFGASHGGGYEVFASLAGREAVWRARFVVDATGKSAGRHHATPRDRVHLDRLVALTSPVDPSRDVSNLLLEAAPAGWWYAAAGETGTHVVFLTDADLMPKGRVARLAWLRQQYSGLHLLRSEIGEEPQFERYNGCDARRSFVSSPWCEGWVAVGDAAWSNDPLSGSGIQLAAEGAIVVATCIHRYLAGSRTALVDYWQWCRDTHRKTLGKHRAVYRGVDRSLRAEPFWQRRIAVADGPGSVVDRAI